MSISHPRMAAGTLGAVLVGCSVLSCSGAIPGTPVPVDAQLNFRAVLSETKVAAPTTPAPPAARGIAEARTTRQSLDPAVQQQALTELSCAGPDVLAANDDPALPLVTCAADGTTKFTLGPSFLSGKDVKGATSHVAQYGGGYVVDLTFTSDGSLVWGKYTGDNVGQRVAFVVDTRVLSAPRINSAITGGTTSITGSFTENEARDLAAALNHQ